MLPQSESWWTEGQQPFDLDPVSWADAKTHAQLLGLGGAPQPSTAAAINHVEKDIGRLDYRIQMKLKPKQPTKHT